MSQCTSKLSKAVATIYTSTSSCIFENLAFEELLFRTSRIDDTHHSLLVWSNRPAVVIGRHQNTWLEVDTEYATKNGIKVVRRHSGGGAVFHDQGNLNISLFTTHAHHCRPENLSFISESLNTAFPSVNVIPNKRDDMELHPGPRKCSGTAARIARGLAYHHLTLLVDADLTTLSRSLKSPYKDQIETTATQSVRAPAVGCLSQDVVGGVDVRDVRRIIVDAFRQRYAKSEVREIDVARIVGSDAKAAAILSELRDWRWIYGKSPKFVFRKTVNVKDGVIIDGPDFVGKQFNPTMFD